MPIDFFAWINRETFLPSPWDNLGSLFSPSLPGTAPLPNCSFICLSSNSSRCFVMEQFKGKLFSFRETLKTDKSVEKIVDTTKAKNHNKNVYNAFAFRLFNSISRRALLSYQSHLLREKCQHNYETFSRSPRSFVLMFYPLIGGLGQGRIYVCWCCSKRIHQLGRNKTIKSMEVSWGINFRLFVGVSERERR